MNLNINKNALNQTRAITHLPKSPQTHEPQSKPQTGTQSHNSIYPQSIQKSDPPKTEQESSKIAEGIENASTSVIQSNTNRLRRYMPMGLINMFKPPKTPQVIIQAQEVVKSEQPALVTTALVSQPEMISDEQALVDKHKAKLDLMNSYACTDATTFSGQVNTKKTWLLDQILNQRPKELAENVERTKANSLATRVAMQKQFTQKNLKSGHGLVEQARAACCSTFAIAVAHTLTEGERDLAKTHPRVEIVSATGGHDGSHCFVVVGRQEGSTLSDPKTWGPKALIVDTWLGSLGHNNVFTVSNYPECARSLLDPDEQLYDSHQPDPQKII